MTTRARNQVGIALLIILVVAAFALSIGWGGVTITPTELIAIFAQELGIALDVPFTKNQAGTLTAIRLPRVLLAAVGGGGFALAGVALQAALRTPLADPQLTGLASGATFGAVLAIVAGLSIKSLWWQPLFAALGALIIAGVLLWLHRRLEARAFLLSGVVIHVFLAAVIAIVILASRAPGLHDANFWNLGSFGGALWPQVRIALPLVLVLIILLAFTAPLLNILQLGDQAAYHLGVPVIAVRTALLLVTACLIGALVAFSGVLGIIGLALPFVMRTIFGADHNILIPANVLAGAALVMVLDAIARNAVAPMEIPIGVLTTALGAPVLMHLLIREGKRHDD